MQAIVNAFWQIALFRQGPDDLPDSRPLLMFALLAYILVDAAVILMLYPPQALVPLLLVDVGFLALWSIGVLKFFGYGARLQRTLTALFGVGALLQVLAFPLSAWPALGIPFEIPLYLRIWVLLIILLWTVAVYAHVFSRSLSRSLGTGLLFSVVYFVVIYKFAAQWGQVS
jgi:hypothetical protein